MSDGRFETVAIVGVGLLGASLGLALKRRGLCARVLGVGRVGSESLKVALGMGAIDEGVGDVGQGVQGADLVVLCTPVRTFPGMMEGMVPHLKKGVVVTDVGSVKGVVMQWAKEKMPGVAFVGSHPMAGSEKSGPGAARADLYEGAVCLMTSLPLFDPRVKYRVDPTTDTGRLFTSASRLKALWEGVGMRTMFLDAATHDKWVALVSHLPHATAGCLVSTTAMEPAAREVAAGGFMDSTRIAGGDVEMWTDIFMTNRGAIVEAINVFQDELSKLHKAVLKGDEGAIRRHFTEAKRVRDAMAAERAKRGKA